VHGFYSSVSGGTASEIWLEKVTNNLANVNTPGYKADHPSFDSYFVSKPEVKNGMASTSVSIIGVNDGVDVTEGSFKPTGNPLDLAIEGEGFFVIDTPAGTRYTRNGTFTLNSEGLLTTNEGFSVMGEGGEMDVSGKDILVAEDGKVVVDGRQAGKLRVVSFADDRLLKKEGSSLFSLMPGGVEMDSEEGGIVQGGLEMSNVNVVIEMTRLISIQRAYESYQKVIQAMGDMSTKATNEIGKPR